MINTNMKINSSKPIIKTPIQASFHLNQGRVLVLPVNRKIMICIVKDKEQEDHYQLTLMHLSGVIKNYEGDFKAVTTMIEEYEFYVIKFSDLEKRKTGILNKMFYRLNVLLGRRG